jgi:hypothetical protein
MLVMRWVLTIVSVLAGAVAVGCSQEIEHETPDDSSSENQGQAVLVEDDAELTPIVAPLWEDGMEVVIRPIPKKLAAHGLKLEQLRELRWRRFEKGEWQAKIGGKTIDLTKVARLTVRKLHVPPFTVILADGRKVVITPNPARIEEYVISGEHFEQCVREALADPAVKEPAKVRVLSRIPVPGGNVPNQWGADHVHISLGEPRERFARVEIRARQANGQLKKP